MTKLIKNWKELSKQEMQELFNMSFLDYEVELFNKMIDAYINHKFIVYYTARRNSKTKLINCFNLYKTNLDGKKAQIIVDELHK